MRNTSTLALILFLAVLAGLLGFNYFARPFQNLSSASPLPVVQPSPVPTTEDSGAAVAAQLAQLSSQQRVAQLLAMSLDVDAVPASNSAQTATSWVEQYQPGFVTLFGTAISASQARDTIANLKRVSSPLSVAITVDHEGGSVQRLKGDGFTPLPSWASLCDMAAASRSALLTKSAQELHAVGIDVVLAPVVDLAPAASGSTHRVLKTRVCDSDPAVVTQRAGEFVSTFQKQGLLPVLKHFPGIGQTTRDLHFQFDRVTVTATEAGIYRSLLESYPQAGVMTSHVGVINQYPDVPCSLSQACVGELRQNFPQVLLFTDALEMVAASASSPLADRAVAALKAGNHVLVFGESVDQTAMTAVYQRLLETYQADKEFQFQVDEAVKKIIEYKQRR